MNVIEIPGFSFLNISDLPTSLHPSNVYVFLLQFFMDQFNPFSKPTWILGNYFHELESEEIKSMKSIALIRTVGPLLPSNFFDKRNIDETDSSAHLWKIAKCIDWLNTKEPANVVYVSFGSFRLLPKEKIHEIALCTSEENLSEGFLYKTSSQGLVVPWCSQLKVISHVSVGAFMMHCGWNSMLESLTLGVPMLKKRIQARRIHTTKTRSNFVSRSCALL
jgi:hypothetical protein